MKVLRPVELEKCAICGEEFDKLLMHRVFVGRPLFICNNCKNQGNREMEARHEHYRQSYKGRNAENRKR